MTRVNLISPVCLYDQHIIAEWREIPRIPNAVRKLLLTKGTYDILKEIPQHYTLGKGHVKHFYNKLQFIKNRHELLKEEGRNRGLNLESITINLEGIPEIFKNDFFPQEKDVILNLQRITEKINLKPKFYKHYRK